MFEFLGGFVIRVACVKGLCWYWVEGSIGAMAEVGNVGEILRGEARYYVLVMVGVIRENRIGVGAVKVWDQGWLGV